MDLGLGKWIEHTAAEFSTQPVDFRDIDAYENAMSFRLLITLLKFPLKSQGLTLMKLLKGFPFWWMGFLKRTLVSNPPLLIKPGDSRRDTHAHDSIGSLIEHTKRLLHEWPENNGILEQMPSTELRASAAILMRGHHVMPRYLLP